MDAVRVLCIDDNFYNLRLLRKMLQTAGYEVLLAQDASTGVALAKQSPPDIILLDIGLPDASGFDVLRTLKLLGKTQDIPVVAVTAHGMHGDREMCLQAGFDNYVAKPVMRNELCFVVNQVLDRQVQ